nr:MAG: ORF1 [Totiviridae sp.]
MADLIKYNNVLKSTANVPNQINIMYKFSDMFKSIYPKLDSKSIMNEFVKSVSEWEYFDDVDESNIEWASKEHMDLKLLTGTKLSNSINRNVPDMLKFQLSELFHLHNNNATFIKFKNLFVGKLTNVNGATVTVNSFKDTFKALSINIKRNMDYLDITYVSLIDIDLLVGYNIGSPLTLDAKKLLVQGWCKGYIKRGALEEDYYNKYRQSIDIRLNNVTDFKSTIMSLEDFILNVDLWMTDGSARGERVNIVDVANNNKSIKSRSKKQVLALEYDINKLSKMCRNFDHNKEFYSVSEKVEPGRKGRCIISAHFVQQIRLAYIEYCLGTMFNKCFPDIYFLNSQKVQNKIVDDMVRFSQNKDKQLLFLPLDASAFDQEVSKAEIEIVFDALYSRLLDYESIHPDVLEMILLAKYAWFNSNVIIDKIYNMGKWEHGVPSGVRWTALMDSIVNNLRYDVCVVSSLNNQKFGPIITHYVKFQGDDMYVVLRRAIDVERVLSFYNIISVTIHPFKNFLSLNYSEFLRKIYWHGKQYAYPNRMITKYLFRLPEKRGANTTSSLCRERVVTVFRLANRADNMQYFEDKVIHIFKVLLNISNVDTISNILLSPSIFGGFGLVYNMSKSSRAARKILKITWLDNDYDTSDQISNINLTGVYAQQLNYCSRITNNYVGDSILQSSLKQALDPVKRSLFIDRVIVKAVDFKFSPNFSLRFNFTNTGMGRYRPWMSKENLKLPSMNDLLAHLRNKNDISTLVKLTAYEVMDVLNLLKLRGGDILVWQWCIGKIPMPSILTRGLNDLSRSDICKRIYFTYITRMLYTHTRVSLNDFEKLCVLVDNYVKQNIIYAICNNYVSYTTD